MFSKPKPSEYLRRSLAGRGFALDDLVSRHAGDPKYEDVIQEVLALSDKYKTAEFPIGISNPAVESELETLASKLEAEGS
jgi:hypothetical protein